MRLSVAQTRQITHTVRQLAGGTAEVYLFGSRLDDNARGGDVDLLIESAAPLGLLQRARIKMELEAALSLPVDIVVHRQGVPLHPIDIEVRATGVRL